ncbi:hypothetical protein [Paenibacillus sp. YPG26]|uniref:hypothetical protein n=1 Tax=Paenibacillus sp. YPG26 TaxID=2878915 RepID=UPI00203CDEE2|nr:hypothetical protein [Paenibacillus sp. YPG26]USB32003.1 hypothetical protein LDO05_11725 [Paenibacillus sp. YPG26]
MRSIPICILLALIWLTTTGCSQQAKNIAQTENSRYNMTSYQTGNLRAKSEGRGLNSSFIKRLKDEFGRQGLMLTNESYAEGPNGHISYSYLIQGYPGHYIIAHAFSSEQQRMKEMSEMYSHLDGEGSIHRTASNAAVVHARANTALVYASQGQKEGPYTREVERIFRVLLGE